MCPHFFLAVLFSLPQALHADEIVINAVGDIMLAGKWAPILKKKAIQPTAYKTERSLRHDSAALVVPGAAIGRPGPADTSDRTCVHNV